MKIWKAIAEHFGWRESEADKYEKAELMRKIDEGGLDLSTEKSISIAREIGNLEGLRRWLTVKNFNCAYGLSPDEILAVDHIAQNAIECRTVAKEMYADKA